jgi:hypothetical protein
MVKVALARRAVEAGMTALNRKRGRRASHETIPP